MIFHVSAESPSPATPNALTSGLREIGDENLCVCKFLRVAICSKRIKLPHEILEPIYEEYFNYKDRIR